MGFRQNHAVLLNLSHVRASAENVVVTLNFHLAGLNFLLYLGVPSGRKVGDRWAMSGH
jgi:hypothetical protein